MSYILAGALQGFGTGLMDLAEEKKQAAAAAAKRDADLAQYRAKKEIDLEFSRKSKKGSGSSSSKSGVKLGKPKPLTEGMQDDLRAKWSALGIDEATQNSMLVEAEKLYGGTNSKATVMKYFGDEQFMERGPDQTLQNDPGLWDRITGGDPGTRTVPGQFTGKMLYEGRPAAPATPAPAAPATPAAPKASGAMPGFGAMSTSPAQPPAPAPGGPAVAGAPPVGTEMGGYRFLGGNPNDKTSWQEI